jgi:hypothetical protein
VGRQGIIERGENPAPQEEAVVTAIRILEFPNDLAGIVDPSCHCFELSESRSHRDGRGIVDRGEDVDRHVSLAPAEALLGISRYAVARSSTLRRPPKASEGLGSREAYCKLIAWFHAGTVAVGYSPPANGKLEPT